MPLNIFKTSLTFTSLISLTLAIPSEPQTPNANHVFNAIHSSMRQWGSSLNHNGMSFFLATVPAGTQLYHGTSNPEVVKGMQWLAFEPEHALIFARPRGGPPPGDGRRPPQHEIADYRDDDTLHKTSSYRRPDGPSHRSRPEIIPSNEPRPPLRGHDSPVPPPRHPHEGPPAYEHPPPDSQEPLMMSLPGKQERKHNAKRRLGARGEPLQSTTGYLHTYAPTHPLQLLYVDGLSAGKTNNGTLDTQDMLLLNFTQGDGPMGGENERAIALCNLTSTLWEDKIDGILRMEGGFEIILCDFKQHLRRTDVIAVKGADRHGGPGGPSGLVNWQYNQAIASRYHGIGGGRVAIDYENFVSVFAYPDLDELFINDVQSDYAMPRLQNVKDTDLVRIRDDVTKMILHKDWDSDNESKNWQAVTDMVVQRFSKPLHYLHTDSQIRKDKTALAAYLTTLLRPFMDESNRNATLETNRCISQFVTALPTPPQLAASLAHRNIHAVTHQICDALFTSLSVVSSSTPHWSNTSMYVSHAIEVIDRLYEYLHWTSWKECGACGDVEVCFIPVWPIGNHEDHAHPQCRSEAAASGRSGYWGSRGGPPGKGGPPGNGGPPGSGGPPGIGGPPFRTVKFGQNRRE